MSDAGDVNGDGFEDFIIGAPGAAVGGNAAAGRSYVVFGGAALASTVALSALNGSNGFALNGIDADDASGFSVSSAGDVNGDGFGDLIVGARDADGGGNYSGESYVIFGGPNVGSGGSLDLATLNGSNGFVLNGVNAIDRSGHSVSSAGDLNRDGFDDLVVGAFGADANGDDYAGESYVIFGGANLGAGGGVDLGALNGSNGFVLRGIDPGDRSGFSVSSADDVNGDGYEDLIIGARNADSTGDAYVIFGGPNVGSNGALELAALNGATSPAARRS
jgi:hypothetical protein